MSQAAKPLRILLAEDGKVNQQVAVRLLEQRGHIVAVADNGQQAVEAVKTHAYDIILMDVHMPVMDGLEATRQIRKLDRFAMLPIVAITADGNQQEQARCLAAGTDGFLAKPFEPEELFQIIEDVVVRRQCANPAPAIESNALLEAGSAGIAPEDIFDRQRALANVNGSEDILCEMISMFDAECRRQMDDIRQAGLAGDRERLQRAAHALKGSFSLFAAGSATEAVRRIEALAREDELQDYDEAWAALKIEVGALMEALRR